MPFRPDSEIREHFAGVVRQLDENIDHIQQTLGGYSITIHDHSNRSGFEWSGVPYFLWEHWFEQHSPRGPEIALSRVIISYLEPPETGIASEVTVHWVAEIFQLGQTSRFKRDGKQKFSLSEFLVRDLLQTVLDSIQSTQHQFRHIA